MSTTYIQAPKSFRKGIFAGLKLSPNAKLAYIAYRDRQTLSQANNWKEADGDVYFIYSNADLAEELEVSKNTAIKVKKELIKAGLLSVTQNRSVEGYADHLRLVDFMESQCKDCTPPVQNLHPNDLDLNKTKNTDKETNEETLNGHKDTVFDAITFKRLKLIAKSAKTTTVDLSKKIFAAKAQALKMHDINVHDVDLLQHQDFVGRVVQRITTAIKNNTIKKGIVSYLYITFRNEFDKLGLQLNLWKCMTADERDRTRDVYSVNVCKKMLLKNTPVISRA